MGTTQKYVVWFKEVDKDDGHLVGGKGANLGEMVQAGFPVPPGFVVTAPAYFYFLEENNLKHVIETNLAHVDYENTTSLQEVAQRIKKEIVKGKMPEDLAVAILGHYHKLGHPVISSFKEELVAVRSSATGEDGKSASFAGQQETFLNIAGDHELLEAVKRVYGSLFEARAIFYRKKNNINHFKVAIAVPVQKMIESDTSGVMFTVDPVTNDKSKIVIEGIYGLGEYIVQGKVTPDHYELDKKTLHITQRVIENQDVMFKKSGKENKELKVPKSLGEKQKITDTQLRHLAQLGAKLERHYYFPQDIEWAIEGGNVYIVQTRPVTTTIPGKTKGPAQSAISHTPILRGDPASPGMGSGPVKIVRAPSELEKVKPGDVLVAPSTNPDYVPAMKKAAAIITERGGRTSHAAIVSRELGIPAVVGVEFATKMLHEEAIVTVNGATGEIYKGGMQQGLTMKDEGLVQEQIKTRTKVYVNLAESDRAFEVSKMGMDGVGLLRAEFMIADIGTHPKKLIDEGKKKQFVDVLADKLAIFCKAFAPRPVVYRISDLKSNEYRNLKGGAKYEKQEENPMVGFRGAYRHMKDPDVFELEVSAIKKVREHMGYKNLWVMIPFARTPQELEAAKRHFTEKGLIRSDTFKLWLMVETPANVLMFEDFVKIGVDGISIGSNDLTMLTLGIDRDNEHISELFDEQNKAVLWLIEHAVKEAKKHGLTSSICGQLPSVAPEFVAQLVDWGITSVSVSPDAVAHVRSVIAKAERKHV